MKEYKRMTKQSGWKADMDLTQEMGYSWIYQRLSELENKIEQGTLIELPCKDFGAFPCEMGATVWLIYKRYWNVADKNGFWVLRESKVSPHNKKRFSDDFGKFVFLTREEAEIRLKELKNAR